MRTLWLCLCLTALAQNPPPDQGMTALQEASVPVETWMGVRLRFSIGGAFPFQAVVFDPGTAIGDGDVFVSVDQARALPEPRRLAEFLAHAAAHAKLRHPQRTAEVLRLAQIFDTTHAPARVAAEMLDRTRREMEDEANAEAAKLMEAAGCAATACDALAPLFEALRRL